MFTVEPAGFQDAGALLVRDFHGVVDAQTELAIVALQNFTVLTRMVLVALAHA